MFAQKLPNSETDERLIKRRESLHHQKQLIIKTEGASPAESQCFRKRKKGKSKSRSTIISSSFTSPSRSKGRTKQSKRRKKRSLKQENRKYFSSFIKVPYSTRIRAVSIVLILPRQIMLMKSLINLSQKKKSKKTRSLQVLTQLEQWTHASRKS